MLMAKVAQARLSFVATVVVGHALAACGPSPVIATEGILDSTTGTFELAARSYRVEYSVADRDPNVGCEFRLMLLRQPADPLAPGVPVSSMSNVTVPARGTSAGSMPLTPPSAGSHYLRIGGACAWSLTVVSD